MADKEDTWSWWDALKAGGTAVMLGMGAGMARGQHRAGNLNAINKFRGPAQSGLKRLSAARDEFIEKSTSRRRTWDWDEKTGAFKTVEAPGLPSLGQAADDALNAYYSARRDVRDLESQIARNRAVASAKAQRQVLEQAAPVYREMAALRKAGVPFDPVHFGVERYSDQFDRSGKFSPRSVPGETGPNYPFFSSRSGAIVVPWTPDDPGLAKPKLLRRAVDRLREARSGESIEGAERTILRDAVKDVAVAKAGLKKPLKDFDDMRQEVLKLQDVLANPETSLFSGDSLTAVNLRNYYAFRRAYRSSHDSPDNLMLPMGMLPPDRGLLQTSFRSVTKPRSDRVQGPFERVAKIAWSYAYPPYRVEKPPERKLPEGKKPPLLDRWQERASKSTWGRYIPSALGWAGLALTGYNVLNKLDRQKEQKEGVEARARQERNALMAGFTNAVQTAAAVPKAAMYGREGLHAVVAGAAAARGLGDAGAADALLARVPPEVLYSHGLQSFDRTPADVRAAMGLGGKSALDLSDEEMHEFARRHLSGLADQYLNSWTNPVPASAEGGL